MKMRKNTTLLLAAVTTIAAGAASLRAGDLIWNPPGTNPPTDALGSWDLTSPNWFDSTLGSNVVWNNNGTTNAVFGNLTNAYTGAANTTVDLGGNTNQIVQDMTFNISSTGGAYEISSFGGGTLTIMGNVTKNTPGGAINFTSSGITLGGTNQHVFTLRDTGGDAPEMNIQGVISGTGGLTLDNGSYESWGTLVTYQDNTYAGPTVINKGRLVINTAGGLSTSATTVSGSGSLSIGGAGVTATANLTISNKILITRSLYTGGDATDGGAYGHYGAAVIANNGAGTVTFTGITLDSADGRLAANSSVLRIPGSIAIGPDAPANPVLSVTGDFAGFVELDGDNRAVTGGINIVSGVELIAANQNALGGASSSLSFTGGGTLRVTNALMQDFGTHAVNYGSFNGGVDVLNPTDTFTVSQNLTGASFGKRGLGTLNLTGTNMLNTSGSQTFWDGGTVNVTGSTTLSSLHLRSPVVNITGSITTTAGYNSLGSDSTGTNGGPDQAIVNISGNGSFVQTSGDDFNISDNSNTTGTINITGNGNLTTGGITWLGKSGGAVGTINQNGGSVNINRTGDFALVLGDARGKNVSPTGNYTLNSGTLSVGGEMYMGEGNGGAPGIGHFVQTGGSVTVGNWVVFGREGGYGTMDMSGGTFTETGGNFSMGESNSPNTLTLHGTAQMNQVNGEFWVGNNGGNVGTMTMNDTASLSVGNWFVVGRFGASGTMTLGGHASVTKSGGGNTEFAVGGGGVANVTLGGDSSFTATTGELHTGQGGGSNGTLNIQDNAVVTFSSWVLFGRDGGTGTLNISGNGSLIKNTGGNFDVGANGGSVGTINQTGGSVKVSSGESWLADGGGNATYNLSGGTLTTELFDVGHTGGGNAVLTVSGNATMTATTLRIGEAEAVNGTLNLNGGSITADTLVTRNSTGTKTFNFNGGTLSATTISVAPGLSNTGTGKLAPGGVGTVGATTVTTGYTQGSNATLAIDIASDSSYDQLTANASSVINGILSVDSLGSYVPTPGVYFNVFTVTAGTLTGMPTLGGPDAAQYKLRIVNGTTLQLTNINSADFFLGDFNADGGFDVSDIDGFVAALGEGDPFSQFITDNDAAFFATYGQHLTTAAVNSIGDFNGDGGFDVSDIDGFVLALSGGSSAPTFAASVPEPTSAALLGLAIPALASRRRRGR